MKARSDEKPGAAGFTLLEVLASVAILGIAFTVLATVAIQGLRAEGESRRRLDASMLADEILMDMETQLSQGIAPPVTEDEREAGEFTVRVSVLPFDLTALDGLAGDPSAPGAAAAQGAMLSLLAATTSPDASPLRTVQIEVLWQEGVAERSVSRTTYAFDLQSVMPILEQIQIDEPGAGPEITQENSTDVEEQLRQQLEGQEDDGGGLVP